MLKHIIRRALLLFPLILLICFSPSASAERPSDAAKKGEIPACSCTLETSGEPEKYDPVPVDVGTVYIGLDYGSGTVEDASFVNESGEGFAIGYYDAERQFHPLAKIPAAELRVRAERNWYLLFDEIYSNAKDAAAAVAGRWGRSLIREGAYRAALGPFDSREEVEFLITRYGFSGQPWHERALCVYDGQNIPRYFSTDLDEPAVCALSNGKAQTRYRGERYYGGFRLRVEEDLRLTVINAVELEDYVKGVIPYEMSPSWPYEALKAQAVCARTYVVYNRSAYEEDYGFDLTDDTESQVYRGLNGANAVTDAAVDETAGLFVRWHGELCEVYYFASDGGATEDGAGIFGSDRPYLAGKTDPFEAKLNLLDTRWARWRSGEEIAWRLKQRGYEIGTVVRIEPVYSELGNVIAMSYYDENGVCVSLEHRDSYTLLILDNCRFTVEADEDGFLFRGVGWGHNCGMSQWGANAMAGLCGYDAEDIVEFYFTGATIG